MPLPGTVIRRALRMKKRRDEEPIFMRAIAGLNSPISFRISCVRLLALLAVLAATLCWTQMAPAQAAATTPSAHKATHRHKRAAKAPKQKIAQQPAPAPVAPPAPEMPAWPVNEKPVDASIRWDGQGLTVNATNSSLRQILKEVASVTGATVEGLNSDERVFGVYGPGKARDVLSQLLHGTSYNVLMIGDQGEGTPREIVLSTRNHAAGTASAANSAPAPANDDDADSDVDDQAQQPPPQPQPPIRPGFGPGGQRNPQQMHPQPGMPQPQQPNTPQ